MHHYPSLIEPPDQAGGLGRRRFLKGAAGVGIGAAMAGRLAAQSTPRQGGMLRVSMNVYPLDDPRLFDLSEQGNIARAFLEPLVRYARDLELRPWLLARWEHEDGARRSVLHLRRDAIWTNGDRFDADDVIVNLRRWCDRSVPGNSMAARMDALIDPGTGRMDEDAVERVDDFTIRLHLRAPDASLIAGMADYPALIVHRDFDSVGAPLSENPVGTGAFEMVAHAPGERAEAVRRRDGRWWGGAAHLDGVIWRHTGGDPADQVAAFEAGEVDVNYETAATFAPQLDALGLVESRVLTANTLVSRVNVRAQVEGRTPYADIRMRRAIQLSVDNATVLAIGHGDRGLVAEDCHVGLMHPDYAPIAASGFDPAEARRLADEAGMAAFQHELISIDDGWRRDTADVIAAMMADAGLRVRRRILSSAEFWGGWTTHPFSVTNWNMRPLGVQVLALAYRSGESWNETGFSDPEFDATLADALSISDDVARRPLMERLQTILQQSGVIVQPYWRSILCHMTPRLRGYAMHQTFEMHLENVWLEAPDSENGG